LHRIVRPARETRRIYDASLAQMRERGLDSFCANPDIVVQDGEELAYLRGRDRRTLRGDWRQGDSRPASPFRRSMKRALAARERFCAGAKLARAGVLAIGDAMRTDIKGACDQGPR